MFKVAIKDPETYLAIKKIPVLRAFFSPRITAIPDVPSQLFTQFISVLRSPRGLYMYTEENRFKDLDMITAEYVRKSSSNIIHDVGVSTGVTTFNLYETLSDQGLTFELNMSEKFNEFTVSGRRVCKVYAGPHFIEGYFFGLVASESVSWVFPLTRVLYHFMRFSPSRADRSRISIMDPRLRNLIASGRISEVKYDILSRDLNERYTYVRCMNVLNKDYFDRDEMRLATESLAASLIAGGILQVGRTDPVTGRHKVTFFRKRDKKLIVDNEINGGSDIKDWIGDMIA